MTALRYSSPCSRPDFLRTSLRQTSSKQTTRHEGFSPSRSRPRAASRDGDASASREAARGLLREGEKPSCRVVCFDEVCRKEVRRKSGREHGEEYRSAVIEREQFFRGRLPSRND